MFVEKILPYIIVIICAYLIGSFSPSYIISRIKKVDLKKTATRNLGASNATVVLGWKFGVLVAVVDIAKGAAAVLLTRFLAPELPAIAYAAGAAVILGHIFPFYLKFRGGKGFATYIGAIAGLNFPVAVVLAVAIIALALITNYLVVGTFITIISYPVFLLFFYENKFCAAIMAIPSMVVLFKHHENIVRIQNGTEGKVRALFGKGHREKAEKERKELDAMEEAREEAKKAAKEKKEENAGEAE